MAGPISRAVLIAILCGTSLPAVSDQDRDAQAKAHAAEAGCLDGRAADHLRRHGEMDPEAKLELARQTYDSLRGPRAMAIAGATWLSLGPDNTAGRIDRIAVHPNTIGTILAGSAGGGVWRSTDSGASWTSLTDTIPNLRIGAVAYAPSSPSTIYAGTGEGDMWGNPSGIGLIWSTDGGASWNFPTTVLSKGFYAISVHPTNANDVIVGTVNGAFRSTTGPAGPWIQIIAGDSSSASLGYGAVTDLERDPTNPSLLYAATFDQNTSCARSPCVDPRRINGSTVLKSLDGGGTWSPSATGLAASTATQSVSRWAVAIAPSSPSTLYAATSTRDYTSGTSRSRIYKSTDGGGSWTETSLSSNGDRFIHDYLIQTDFDNAIIVSPTDPNLVVAAGVLYVRTRDGGVTWSRILTSSTIHVDAHDLVYNSTGLLHIANDGGVWTSADDGTTATARNHGLITRQYHSLATDPIHRHRMFGGMQDNGTNRRPDAGGTSWADVPVGGDGGGAAVLEHVPSYVFASSQNGRLLRTTESESAVPEFEPTFPVLDIRDRAPFITLVAADPANAGVVYTGTWRLWKSTSGGDAWAPLPTSMSDGTTWPNGGTLTAFAISRSSPRTIIAANSVPTVRRSTDGGLTWRAMNTGLPMSPGGTLSAAVNAIDIDPRNDQNAWLALAITNGASVYFSSNGGASWTQRSSGLPQYAALSIRVDPTDSGTIYCGTDVGVYRSTDQGATWLRFGAGLPAVSAYEIQILADGSKLRVATHGRGVWELNITGATNRAPTAAITTRVSRITVRKGETVTFNGTVSDSDAGDPVTGQWIFPDTWETVSTDTGASSVAHTFHTVGTFPVTLRARDGSAALAAAHIEVSVSEPADDCSTAPVIPDGPYPITARVSNRTASVQGSDPNPVGICFDFPPYATNWSSFTPSRTGTYEISLCGTADAALVALYTGEACGPYSAVPDGCLVDLSPQTNCGTGSKLSVSLTAGAPIRILTAGGGAETSLTISRGAVATAVTSIAPNAGSGNGGASVILYGSGFTAPATVSFGGVAATNVIVAAPNIITATVPVHAAGAVDVTVTCGSSSGTLAGGYTYTGGTKHSRRRAVRPASTP